MSSPKRIVPVVETGPNYVFRLMAIARIGFNSDYPDRYCDTVELAPQELCAAGMKELAGEKAFGDD